MPDTELEQTHYHGVQRYPVPINDPRCPVCNADDHLTPTLDDYRGQVRRELCRWDNVPLPETVLYYPHPGGWPVRGMQGLQWLFLRCPKCDYDWALSKLGVPRAKEYPGHVSAEG
jgi:hypothetical protein